MLAAEMGRMGLSSRPTVAEWLEKKNKQKKEELRNSLIHWKRLTLTWPVYYNLFKVQKETARVKRAKNLLILCSGLTSIRRNMTNGLNFRNSHKN